MKSTIISEIMIRDHGKIVKLLTDFEKSINLDKKTKMKAYYTFLWELEKHFFTEEKAIFISYEPEDKTRGYAMIPELIKEHNEIFKRLKTMKKTLKNNKDFDFQDFKIFLTKHKNFEDENVYPIFDQELDESEKKMIIHRINDINMSDNMLSTIKVKCSECGKKIGVLDGYHHPKFDRKWIFCKNCYDKINKKN